VGAVHLSMGPRNVLDLLSEFPGKENIPVVAGYNSPLSFSNMFPYPIRNCADMRYHQTWAVNPRSAYPGTPLQFLQEVLQKDSVNDVRLLMIGGATTMAHALTELPTGLLNKFSFVSMMGGNILHKYVPKSSPYAGAGGNIQYAYPLVNGTRLTPYNNSVAEWNIFVDPVAAHMVFKSTLPITLVALNACGDVPLNGTFADKMKNYNSTAAKIVYGIVTDNCVLGDSGQTTLQFWDPLAALVLVDPTLVNLEVFSLDVFTTFTEDIDYSGEIIASPPSMTALDHGVAMFARANDVWAAYFAMM